MNIGYIGSKLKLLNFIEETIDKVIPKDFKRERIVFADLFAGTGVVGNKFREKKYTVISNDIQYYSYVLNKNLIESDKNSLVNNEIIENLDNIVGIKGFVFKNYCPEISEKMFFTNENGMKCDAIRNEIELMYSYGEINKKQYFNLLSGLLYSIDKVSNTTSVYGSYLKHFKSNTTDLMKYKLPLLHYNCPVGKVYNEEAKILIKKIKGDILYLDPPYNSRQYGSNYHLLETIAKNDKPELKGKIGLRKNYIKSKFCSKKEATNELEEIIKKAKFKYIFLSYNNEGIIPFEKIKEIFSKYGEYKLFKKEHQRYKSDSDKNRKHKSKSTIEFLHVLIKNIQ